MKKIILSFVIIFSILICGNIFAASSVNCWADPNWEITDMLNDCQPDNSIDTSNKIGTKSFLWWAITVTTSANWGYEIKDLKGKILFITTNLLLLASLLAIWWIVYAWVLFTTAYWDDKHITKAKDAIKRSLIGFALALISQQLVNAIINLVYKVGK